MGSKPERRSRDHQNQFGGDHNGDIARESLGTLRLHSATARQDALT
jgi:hypothetical protein